MKTLVCGLFLSAFVGMGMAQQAAVPAQAVAEDHPYTPFMLSFADPLQIPTRDFNVGGLRVPIIYGQCHDFDGLDAGFVGRTTGHANGFQTCAINVVDGDGMGLQANWLAGYVSGEYLGFQVGTVNYAQKAQGLQIGFYNGADFMKGLQIGVINISREMIGMQIGVVNVIQNKDVAFIPIINCYF